MLLGYRTYSPNPFDFVHKSLGRLSQIARPDGILVGSNSPKVLVTFAFEMLVSSTGIWFYAYTTSMVLKIRQPESEEAMSYIWRIGYLAKSVTLLSAL